MRTRESGLPDEATWESFFDADAVLDRLALAGDVPGDVVDLGCGFGTFTVAVARRLRPPSVVRTFDIEPAMVERTRARAAAAGLDNVEAAVRDFVEEGTGLADGCAGAVLLFNLLHAAEWRELLRESRRVLAPEGRLAVIHWNHDPRTPRGPSMAIRLTPGACEERVAAAGFRVRAPGIVDLPPHHFGLTAEPDRAPGGRP